MRMRMIWAIAFVGACACKSGSTKGTTGGGGGDPSSCDAVKAHVEELYRAAASGDNIDEQVADNTQMVMNDCVAQPDKVAPCAEKAKTAADLEARCLIPLDEEGSEGDRFKEGS